MSGRFDPRATAQDRDPQRTQALILAAFAASPKPLTRRQAEVAAFGHTSYTATWASLAVRELRERGYLETSSFSDRYFRATKLGRDALDVWLAVGAWSEDGVA